MWRGGRVRSLASRLLLCSVLGLALSSSPAQAQSPSSPPPSTDTEQASQPTTPTEGFVSGTLRPLLAEALTSSEASDANSATLQERIDSDARQKIEDDKQRQIEAEQRLSDDAARKKEQEDSATAYARLSLRVQTLQSCFDAFSLKLTDFSGSEEEKQARALAALNDIQAGARRMERQNRALKWACGILAVATAGAITWAAVK